MRTIVLIPVNFDQSPVPHLCGNDSLRLPLFTVAASNASGGSKVASSGYLAKCARLAPAGWRHETRCSVWSRLSDSSKSNAVGNRKGKSVARSRISSERHGNVGRPKNKNELRRLNASERWRS
jgi:hypothetical protein